MDEQHEAITATVSKDLTDVAALPLLGFKEIEAMMETCHNPASVESARLGYGKVARPSGGAVVARMTVPLPYDYPNREGTISFRGLILRCQQLSGHEKQEKLLGR